MSTTKSVVTAAGALALVGVGAFVGTQLHLPQQPDVMLQQKYRVEEAAAVTLRDENRRLQREVA